MSRARCRYCGRIGVRITTDGRGRAVEVAEPCACVKRKAAGLCRTCPAPLRSARSTYCAACAYKRRLEAQNRCAHKKADRVGPAKPPEWRKDIDEAKRLAGVCQLCIKPVAGRLKVALYCERHKKIRLAAAQRKHNQKVGNKHGRAHYQRHRDEILAKERERHRKDWRARKRKNDYKREWRKKNRDKVRAQKRRHALRGKLAEAMRRRRARLGDAARVHQNPAPRNDRGERLCLGGCATVLTGRAKMCAACKAAAVHGQPKRRAA